MRLFFSLVPAIINTTQFDLPVLYFPQNDASLMNSPNKTNPSSDSPVRYVVGIDLGTTNCAMSFVDLETLDSSADSPGPVIKNVAIPQVVAPDIVESRATLPSFFARLSNVPPLPWQTQPLHDFSLPQRGTRAPRDGLFGVVGAVARDYATARPNAVVPSAKSWLCNANVDRSAKFLPLRVAAEPENGTRDPRWSPVEVSSFYLAHLRDVWNAKFPDFPLETQDVVLTIPASFDETARSLTLKAAKLAGLPRVSLVEEPQAAFYAWLERHEKVWTDAVRPGDRVLVCDVGGGTTDFALIYALRRDKAPESSAEESKRESVKFYRVAVGEHLVLGGDNLDLALSRFLEQKLLEKRSKPLSPWERAVLLQKSRETKEEFLGDATGAETRRILIPSASSKLVGGGLALDVNRAEVEKLLVDGFFPRVPLDAQPDRRREGLREIALPYAFDPAVTKHLAFFLRAHRNSGDDLIRAGVLGEHAAAHREGVDPARPDAILFNGGAFESAKLRERVVESIVDWFGGDDPEWRPHVLKNDDLYLAVSHGATYYGLVLRGYGERVGASLARSYYVQVSLGAADDAANDKQGKGVCLLPAQAEPGDEIALDQVFELAVDKPVSFPIFVSSVRTTDAPGDLVALDPNETRELSPIRTALKTRSKTKKAAGAVKARLVARPTEIGTIELFLQEVLPKDAGPRARASRWTLQFDARGAVQSDWQAGNAEGEGTGVVDESLVEGALEALERVFGDAPKDERLKPRALFRAITEATGISRDELPILALRRLAERTIELSEGRRQSAAHEARWLNWLGFALRPGFGAAMDDWRVESTWKTIAGRLAFRTPESRTQYWILWRRIASGLTSGRQLTLAEPLFTNVRNLRRQLVENKGRGADLDLTSQEGAEIWRLLGALELLPPELREELGDAILDILPKKKATPIRDPLIWSLGRVGARRPFHAPLDRVTPPALASRWARRLIDYFDTREEQPNATGFFALAQLARRAEDPRLDVDVKTREAVAAFLLKHGAEDSTLAALERHGKLVDDATRQAFGETLPLGLIWS